MKEKAKKNNSAMKKLIPATSMLLVSATMLATSTYAWFTMSREVEVQNIRMTATVPANLQISAGKLSTAAGSGDGYVNNKGILVKDTNASNASDGNVAEPDDTSEYWSSSIDLSKYYVMGRIMPASSTNGLDVFFTPDASGVGKTLNSGAKFYQAVDDDTVKAESTIRNGATKTHLAATLHAFTVEGGDGWLEKTDTYASDGYYEKSTEWNVTKDDGYYVDIPLWIRSSSTDQDIDLAVDAFVKTDSKKDGDDLYLAARAVILDSTRKKTSNLLEIRPDSYTDANGNPNNQTIVDFMSSTSADGEAVASVANNVPTYGTVTHYQGDVLGANDNILHIAKASTAGEYGTPTKFYVRVWLEGEDPNCWNDNAGQDFSINLRFTRDKMYNTVVTGGDNSHAQTYPAASTSFVAAVKTLMEGDTTNVTLNGANLVYEWNGTDWVRKSGSYAVPPLGQEYSVGDTPTKFSNESGLTAWLKTNVNDTDKAAVVTTVTTVDLANITEFNATVSGSETKSVAYSISTGEPGFTSTSLSGKSFQINASGAIYTDKATLESALKLLANNTYKVTVVSSS